MTYTEQQLNIIKQCGELLIRLDEVGYLLELDAAQVETDLNNKHTPAHAIYMRGKLETKMALRENLLKNAKRGSPIAEQLFNELLK